MADDTKGDTTTGQDAASKAAPTPATPQPKSSDAPIDAASEEVPDVGLRLPPKPTSDIVNPVMRPAAPPPAAPGYPEPKILSETVIDSDAKPIPQTPAREGPALAAMSVMPKGPGMATPVVPPKPLATPPAAPISTSIQKSAAAPASIPAISTMPKSAPEPELTIPKMTLPPTGPTITPQPVVRPREQSTAPAEVDPALAKNQQKMTSDISRILKGVKLPERQEMKGKGDKRIPVPQLSDAPIQGSADPPPPVPKVLLPDTMQEAKSAVTPLHTLKDDIQNVVLEKKISVIRAAAMEQDRRREDPDVIQEVGESRKKRSFGVLFASGLLVFLGLAALLGVYIVEGSKGGATQNYNDSFVFSEQSLLLQISGLSPQGLKAQVASARQSGGAALGSITRLIPVITTTPVDTAPQTRLATTGEFLRALGTNAPDELIRALGDNFFFGIHTVDKNSPVLVIPVTSYDHAFAGMLAWEASMNTDLAPVWTPVQSVIVDANGTPSRRTFQDAIMRNYDVRVLKSDSGEVILYYSFPTPKLLIIAESPYSFNELLSRLQAQRQL